MARTPKLERTLPALPASVGTFAEDGKLETDLAGWLTAMTQLASDGDERASLALIDACQSVPQLWGYLSTLSSAAVHSWVDLLAPAGPGREIVRRATEKEIERKRNEVAGEDPSPLERLLAERVALCWVVATYVDAEYTASSRGEYRSGRGSTTARAASRQTGSCSERLNRWPGCGACSPPCRSTSARTRSIWRSGCENYTHRMM
jgi:hypothetical protein